MFPNHQTTKPPIDMEMRAKREDDGFCVRQYGRQELALRYFPQMTPASAWRKLRRWLCINPRLRRLVWHRGDGPQVRTFTPREVQSIIDELGEP